MSGLDQMGLRGKTSRVPVRGQVYELPSGGAAEAQFGLLVASLLALEDPRVDAVIRAYDIAIVDANGQVLCPRPEWDDDEDEDGPR